ncbi:hypothetical protein GGI07_001811 [Coemansia sp. Benny D115]|nr:hypothetical protein GGI07_001811 [Coemansia sp. Benny D115]
MPPIDFARLRYAPGFEHVRPNVITVLIERIAAPGDKSQGGKKAVDATTTAVIIRETNNELQAVRSFQRIRSHHPCPGAMHRMHHRKHRYGKHSRISGLYSHRYRYRHHRYRNSHHHHHHHHHRLVIRHGHLCHGHGHGHGRHGNDGGDQKDPQPVPGEPGSGEPGSGEPGPEQIYDEIIYPHNSVHFNHEAQYHHPYGVHGYSHGVSAGTDAGLSMVDFALNEIGFLALSFVLSLLLLFAGYKIGDHVCRFEGRRDCTRGRGHRCSMARRRYGGEPGSHRGREKQVQMEQPGSTNPQPIYLEAENEVDDDASEHTALLVVPEPGAARTKNSH